MTPRRRGSDDVVFTHVIDRRIIEGLLGHQKELFIELAKNGFDKNAIVKRAAALDLNNDLIAKCRKGKLEVAARQCLRCNK